ncbi:MAG: hypothetical protein AB7U62_14940, partial [Pseudolabrys sp.]
SAATAEPMRPRVMAIRHPIDPARGRVDLTVPIGTTVARMVELALPNLPAVARNRVRVIIGCDAVPAERWHLVRPKPHIVTIVKLVGGRGQTANILRTVVSIAAIAAAYYVAGAVGGGLVGSLVGAAASTAVLLGGTLLVNALVPPRKNGLDNGDASSPTYSIQGWRNAATPGGPVPAIVGKHRVAPVYAALPYTEAIGDDQYVTSLFVVGYGPLLIENLRIGETPIAEFQNLQIEVRQGFPDDDPITLYPQQVLEEQMQVRLVNKTGTGEAVTRIGPRDVVESSVDIFFPQGLGRSATDAEGFFAWFATIKVEERLVGDAGAFTVVDTVTISTANRNPFRRTIRWLHPERGQYEIRLTRTDTEVTDTRYINQVEWTALRGFRPEYPIAFDVPLALIAVRVKATEQLQGVLDQLNCDATLLCRDWNGAAWVAEQPTRNPAALLRWMRQGPAAREPGADSALDLDQLQDWHAFCTAKGLKYDRVHDFDASIFDATADCAAAGRAVVRDTGTQWTVVVDRALTVVNGHLSPRNSSNFAWERSYPRRPDAFRVRFKDATNGYADAERVVPWPGLVGDPQVIEDLELPGVTDPALVWKETRKRQYEIELRPDKFTCEQDIEALTAARGDLMVLNHDVLDGAQASAHIKAIDGPVVELDEEIEIEAGASYGIRIRHLTEGGIESVTVPVSWPAGRTTALRTHASIGNAAPGDLVFFGPLGSEAIEVVIVDVEQGADLTARISAAAHAPQIEQLVDDDEPSEWTGRVGEIVDLSEIPPGVPAIGTPTTIEGVTVQVIVPLIASVAGAFTAEFELQHRLDGAPTWTTVTVAGAAATTTLTGYSVGNDIELRVRAISLYGAESAYSDIVDYQAGD